MFHIHTRHRPIVPGPMSTEREEKLQASITKVTDTSLPFDPSTVLYPKPRCARIEVKIAPVPKPRAMAALSQTQDAIPRNTKGSESLQSRQPLGTDISFPGRDERVAHLTQGVSKRAKLLLIVYNTRATGTHTSSNGIWETITLMTTWIIGGLQIRS
jgi:hypothetical protein